MQAEVEYMRSVEDQKKKQGAKKQVEKEQDVKEQVVKVR